MNKTNIQEIKEIKLPKNAKLFYIPERATYLLRHYRTNVLLVKGTVRQDIELLIDENQISQTTLRAITAVAQHFNLFVFVSHLSYTNKNVYTQNNPSSYAYRYNKQQWNEIAEEIYNEFIAAKIEVTA